MAKLLSEEYGPSWLFHPMWKNLTVDSDARLVGILKENAEIDETMFLLKYARNDND